MDRLNCRIQTLDICMDTTQLIGIAASVGTGLYLLPQLIKLFKEKKAEQLSVGMMAVLLGGLILWIVLWQYAKKIRSSSYPIPYRWR